jgi:hypothetical protein
MSDILKKIHESFAAKYAATEQPSLVRSIQPAAQTATSSIHGIAPEVLTTIADELCPILQSCLLIEHSTRTSAWEKTFAAGVAERQLERYKRGFVSSFPSDKENVTLTKILKQRNLCDLDLFPFSTNAKNIPAEPEDPFIDDSFTGETQITIIEKFKSAPADMKDFIKGAHAAGLITGLRDVKITFQKI